MKTKCFFVALLLLTFQHLFGQHAADTTHLKKAKSTILLDQLLTKMDLQNNMVRLETVVFPPGYGSRKHTHPCPLFVYVLEGDLLSEFEGVKKIYKAGDVFYEKQGGLHSVTQNNSTTRNAKILVIYLMKDGMDTFITEEH